MRSDGTITIGAKIDTKEFDKQIDYIESRMEEIEHLLKQADLGFEVGDTQKLENEYEKLANRLVDLRKKKQETSEQPLDDGGVSNKNFEKGVERITKKITRMGLAMIGIRSLYGMISSSVSRITEENPQLQAQIDAIKNAIDNIVARLVDLLLPVIQFIVSLIGKLLKSLFGIDIFAKSFNKNMKSANGSVTKIRKQLLGFDELNILNKNGSTGSLGGGTLNVNAPTDINLGNIKKKIQDFFDRNDININLDYVEDALKHPIEYIKTALDHFILPGIKKGEGLSGASGLIFGEESAITKGIKFLHRTFLGGIPGIIENAKSIWEWLFGKNKRGTITDLKEILKSTTGMAGEMSKKIKDEFSKISISYKDGMYEVTTKTGQVVSMTETEFRQLMQALGKNADDILNTMGNTSKGVQDTFITTATETKNKVGKDAEETKDKIIGYINEISGSNKQTNSEIQQGASGTANGVTSSWGAITKGVTSVLAGIEDKSKTSSKKSVDNVKNEYSGLPSWLGNNVFVKLLKEFGVLGTDTGQTFGKGLKNAINKVLDKIENSINSVFTTATNMYKKFGINVPVPKVKFPRLAKGGIINQPGRGVNYGMANIGEKGREGVIPLDNESAMNTLANEISKRIVINLTNVTELDGRVLARNVTQVMNDMNFASNGGVI